MLWLKGVLNRAWGHPEHLRKGVCRGVSIGVSRSDLSYLSVSQFGAAVALASCPQVVTQFSYLCLLAAASALARHVHYVVGSGTTKQVRWITTRWIVAFVTYQHFWKLRYVAVDENVGDSMRHHIAALEIHTTVAGGKSGSKPRPTFVWALFVNVIPKAISDGWGWICERMQVQLADGPRSTVARLAQAATVIGAFWVTSARQLGLRHDLFYRAFE
jgi:hypothetical protein